MGRSYKDLVASDAWQHLAHQMEALRDEMIAVLVAGPEREGEEGVSQDEARASVRMIDSILLVPDTMIAEGEYSEKELRRVAAERNGNGTPG